MSFMLKYIQKEFNEFLKHKKLAVAKLFKLKDLIMFEFMDYIPTPGEKHLGIARVKAFNKIVLRYKIVPKKDGNGYFPVAASYKIVSNGEDSYVSAFVLDSNSDKEDIESLIKKNVGRCMSPASAVPYVAATPKLQTLPKAENQLDLPF